MRAISRYVFIQLVAVTLVVTVALTFGVWLLRSVRLIDYIVNRGLPVDTFLWMVVLLLPTFLGVVLPISTFRAVLFIYNKLTMDGEVVLMLLAGLAAGFVLYVLSNFISAPGLSGKIPTLLAGWGPAGISVLLGIALLFHLEDG